MTKMRRRAISAALTGMTLAVVVLGETARLDAAAIHRAQEPAMPGRVAALDPPVELPAERILQDLTRTALREPNSVRAWTAIARTLRDLRPAGTGEVPSDAEAAAYEALDAVASATPGAVRELRISPAGPHTEIAVRTTGEVKYRLFQRLSDQENPRLTMVLSGASNAIILRDFAGIDRGGVRSVQVAEFGTDTVQIAVALQEVSPFTIFRRGEDIILRIENPEGRFATWSSHPGAVVGRSYAEAKGPAREGETTRSGPEQRAADRIASTAASSPMPNTATLAAAEEGAPPAMAAEVEPEVASAAAVVAPGAGGVSSTSRLTTVFSSIVNSTRHATTEYGHPLALAVFGLLCLAGATMVARRWLAARQRKPVLGPKARPSREQTGSRRAPAPRQQTSSRIWAARTLAANGASVDEIVQKTGLARDAVLLLAPPLPQQNLPAENAATGTFFPDPGTSAARGGLGYYSVRH
jgi:hypothetical protein